MAVEPEFAKKEKRKKSCGQRKLIIGERVEVRSEEDGFLGSWHAGTVIASSSGHRHVKYDHLLTDNGDDNLVDIVNVSPIMDGTNFSNAGQCLSRAHIRPLPPPVKFGEWSLPYGLCVDVYHNEAWWEGVIFDVEDGSAERRIFFPDLGDEMTVGIESLRITQDWDEFTETWHHRGTWLFLELIEEHEQESYLAVSVKQIWYDLREKKGYEKLKDWTSSVRSLWKELVLEVIDDNVKIVIDHFLRVAGLPCSSEQEVQPLLEFNRSASNVTEYPEIALTNSSAIVPVENLGCSNEMNLNFTSVQPVQEKPDQDKSVTILNDLGPNMNLLTESDGTCLDKSVPQSALPSTLEGNSGVSCFNGCNGEQSSNSNSKCRKKGWNWLPAGPDIVPAAESCPDAIIKYAQIGKKENIQSLIMDAKKHLKHLKWEIQYIRDERGIFRQRYISPDRKYYYSLRQVCLDLTETTVKILSPNSQEDRIILHTTPDDLDSSHPEQPEDDQDLDYWPLAVNYPHTESLVIKPEYNLQAVVDWCMLGVDENRKSNLHRKDMVLKARQHLSALGWVFKYVIGSNSKRTLHHCSPEGKSYFSLRSACKACLDKVIGSESSASTCKIMEKFTVSDKAEDQLASGKKSYAVSNTDFNKSVMPSHALSENLSTASCMPQIRKLKRKKKTNSSCLVQIRANSHGVSLPEFKLKDDLEDTRHMYVLRSSKRVKKLDIPSSPNQNPRTVISWLIENNVVLPRAKVIYCSRKKRRPKAEGWITRDGIKCKCCGEVYTRSGFEDHAGSTSCNPASHIFLEDGRSLFDCQLEALNNGNVRNFTGEPHDRLKGYLLQGENDYKCSVCHYGGELILCDRCPSSFHKTCVALEDVPDGDWFCPSCCCRICGNSNSREEVVDVDAGLLICQQCELKYHRGCIQNGVTDKFGTHAKENWFCSEKCEEIFLGLKKLLGKPILVGVPNLTWTLVKSSQYDTCNLDYTDIETLSKLNIAHRVMHECFEPVHEPYSSGDLVEDVLFSKGSVLNRLNFRGFYTVLLERNEELVSVATVRVLGEKAAEIPLVGTRFQYRRLGMCRILMNELEKTLMELGVERLILPAIPSVLKTWTTSFGFSRMTTSERIRLVDYTFLNFQDTTMCHKFLPKRPSAELMLSRGSQPRLQNNICESGGNNDLAGSSSVSEVSQAEQFEESMTMEQRLADVAMKNDTTTSESPVPPVIMPTYLEGEPHQTKIYPECSAVDTNLDKTRTIRGSHVNCFKRRKIPASRN